jgi:hypothetical protein
MAGCLAERGHQVAAWQRVGKVVQVKAQRNESAATSRQEQSVTR